MLPLRSHHFQKVGKKPELTLVWEPEDLEQEPVQQVRRGGAAFPEPLRIRVCPALQRAPFCLVGCPPKGSPPGAPCPAPNSLLPTLWAWPPGIATLGRGRASTCPSKAGGPQLWGPFETLMNTV